jgi:hypothetical protein
MPEPETMILASSPAQGRALLSLPNTFRAAGRGTAIGGSVTILLNGPTRLA